MEPAWGASWIAGLVLITLTTGLHAFGVVMIYLALMRRVRSGSIQAWHDRHPIVQAVSLVAVVGLLLTVLHGIEAGIWMLAYQALGAIDSERDAMLYSLDSFTTRGAADVVLTPQWRLLGALEAADGMLLFGISTAFVFAVFQRVIEVMDRDDNARR
jgi:hypothetical protein